MKKITLQNYKIDKYYQRIVKAVDTGLQSKMYVSPIDVFIAIGLLERRDVENWRAGRIPYLERVIKCNLAKASRILRILRFHGHDLKLKPSHTAYMCRTAGGKIPLRFSKTGEKNIEAAYARHFVRLGNTSLVDAPASDQMGDQR